MTDTPTPPAQQLEEVSCRMKRIVAAASQLREHFGDGPHCEFLAEISGQAALADEAIPRALAALEAVEGAAHGTAGYYSRPPLRAVTGIAIECTADNIERLVHKRVLIIPADAVEVSRG